MATGRSKFVWSNQANFDRVNGIAFTKFSLHKFSVKNYDQVFDKNFHRINGTLTQVHKWNRNVLRINEPVKSVDSQLLFDI